MIAFVVSVNGQRVGTIGIGDSGVLTAHMTWVGRPGEAGDLDLGIGGLDSRTDEHLRWPDPPEIRVGDTVTIQVIETEAVDPPTDRKTPAQLREEERQFLTKMEAGRQDRMRQKLDEELPPYGRPRELDQRRAEPGAAADGGA
ncbi:hypothetical protein J0H58_03850 [bacterium]|nr:hypothetical protein [bacterium]